ncbi:ladderlectin-like isoform X1 [Silurus meridionalis]|uniref:ladderlectin-like isoform X1 n=1 Tax=Silurus meridionalis TaxID=175797 RepID=UPI001EEC7D0A|nr:ladderlectin-like isoform X1 [Silurus meridionalis]XP_046694152.1 ladderlectin-like isoform X1 [Silurus meridionalis]XP_046694159.1 ladderlectin-like isoform X1 [Silurus meridionalis]
MKVWIVCVLLCATFTLRTVTAAAIETGPEEEQVLQGKTTELAVDELINEVEDKEEAPKVNIAEVKSGICPHGWVKYGSRCFRLMRSSLSWISAEQQCAAEQARLASVQSLGDHKFLQSLLDMAGLSQAWIGAYNFQGTWLWVDTARFYYSNWYSLSSVGSYPCALMNSNGNAFFHIYALSFFMLKCRTKYFATILFGFIYSYV